jgi:hypothetical protein
MFWVAEEVQVSYYKQLGTLKIKRRKEAFLTVPSDSAVA